MIKLTAFEQRTIRAAKKLAEELKLRGFTVKYIDFEYALYKRIGNYEIIISSLVNRGKFWLDLWKVNDNEGINAFNVTHNCDVAKADILSYVKMYRDYIKQQCSALKAA